MSNSQGYEKKEQQIKEYEDKLRDVIRMRDKLVDGLSDSELIDRIILHDPLTIAIYSGNDTWRSYYEAVAEVNQYDKDRVAQKVKEFLALVKEDLIKEDNGYDDMNLLHRLNKARDMKKINEILN